MCEKKTKLVQNKTDYAAQEGYKTALRLTFAQKDLIERKPVLEMIIF